MIVNSCSISLRVSQPACQLDEYWNELGAKVWQFTDITQLSRTMAAQCPWVSLARSSPKVINRGLTIPSASNAALQCPGPGWLIDRDYCVSLVKQISSVALSPSGQINMDLIQLLSTRWMWFNFRHHLVRLEDLLSRSLDHLYNRYYIYLYTVKLACGFVLKKRVAFRSLVVGNEQILEPLKRWKVLAKFSK